MKMEQMGGGNNIKYTKVSETGNLDKIQDVYTPDPNFRKSQNEKESAKKAQGLFINPVEKIMNDLLAKQLALVELRKNRGDRTAIKALENEIQNIKSSPEYKNTLN